MYSASSPATMEEHRDRNTLGGLRRLLAPGPDFCLIDHHHPQRESLREFIRQQFHHHHGARITAFHPLLLTLSCLGNYRAALGIRCAAADHLFLEHYLDDTADRVLSSALKGHPVARDQIVEIGNLVSTLNGATQLLFLVLVAMLHRAGYPWVMFTATPQVQRSIARLGFAVTPLCRADPERVPGGAKQWGRYYDNVPEVIAGDIRASMAICDRSRLMRAALQLYDIQIDALARQLTKAGTR